MHATLSVSLLPCQPGAPFDSGLPLHQSATAVDSLPPHHLVAGWGYLFRSQRAIPCRMPLEGDVCGLASQRAAGTDSPAAAEGAPLPLSCP